MRPGSGIRGFTIYVSDNGGPFIPWLVNTTLTSATYAGQPGHSYAFYSVATDNAGNVEPTPTGPQATTIVGPAVTSVVFNDGSAQRSMVTSITLTFNTAVTLDDGAIEVGLVGGGAEGVVLSTAVVDGLTVVTVTFTGDDIVAGSLGDGRYQLVVHAGLVHDGLGQALGGGVDYLDVFFRLFGDVQGTGSVDDTDLALFQAALGTQGGDPGYLWFFDYDGDGSVDQADYDQFLLRYGTQV
jgi:hypothetical protein